ncbi:site-specific integrase [Oscillochloris sp. ZM17-4]|uniref:tyrosine-type recombinase/integrase n=1 Tax=Oscillochloris sp. ZM17-4 TaxID=2866714 RepID=UPI001C72B871|nr:site-specific integrase [Oscillochloris sp. ZM17-4]MBX0328611.1 site-specific integrase [Oscillochloris sp. ZM17-4]
MSSDDRDLIPSAADPAAREALSIAAWLEAKRGRSGSANTARAYTATMDSWHAALSAVPLGLAPPSASEDREAWLAAAATLAQAWAGGGDVAPASFNRRLAIVSSFYTFAARRGLLPAANPISRVDRRRVHAYASAVAPGEDDIRTALAALSGGDLRARRDRALIGVAVETTRRLSEVAGLRWGHLRHNPDGSITLTFARTKGGAVRRDKLSRALSSDLLGYLRMAYGAELDGLAADAAVWVSCSRQNMGAAISPRTLEALARARLGVHFHALRHAGARMLERKGARVSVIQERLGHASLATTGRYLAALTGEENPYADAIAASLGFDGADGGD